MYICEICGTKKRPKKNLCISVKSVGQNFHRISRMNQRQSCLSDYSRICADIWPLANGSRPIYAAIVFCHADFADDADFFSGIIFVPQISQIYTDFLWTSGESLCPISGGICNDRTGRICEICVSSDDDKNLRNLRNLRD